MDDFRPIFQGLADATQALIAANLQLVRVGETLTAALTAANTQLVRLGEALTATTQATQHARDEHGDVRETLARLETLVMEQGQELRALRDRLNGGV